MIRKGKILGALVIVAIFALLLVACGDNTATTSTGAATSPTVAATTTRPNTAMATTAASGATTSAATTSGTAMAGTTSGTAMAGTTAATTAGTTAGTGTTTAGTTTSAATTAATTASSATTPLATPAGTATTASTGTTAGTGTTTASAATFPAVTGATEVMPDPAVASEFNKQFASVGLNNLTPKFYVSDSDPTKLVTDANTALTGAGYTFALPGFSQPASLQGASLGLYTKTGAPDILLMVAPAPTDATQIGKNFLLPNLNLNTTQAQAAMSTFQGHKSAMILASGTNLLPQVIAFATRYASGLPAAGGSGTPGTTPTP